MKSKNDFQRWEIHPQNGSQLRNPTPDLMDICFVFFREIPKGSILGGVSMWLTVGSKKKKISFGFFNGNPPQGKIFQRRNPFFVFHFYCKIRNMYSKILLRIYKSKEPRTLEPLSKYSTSIRSYFGLFWIEIRFKSFLWFTFNKMHLSDVRSGAYITWVLGHEYDR